MKTTSNIVLLLLTAAISYLLGSRATLQKEMKTLTGGSAETNASVQDTETRPRPSEDFVRTWHNNSGVKAGLNPFALKANGYQRGYDVASTNLENALAQIELLLQLNEKRLRLEYSHGWQETEHLLMH